MPINSNLTDSKTQLTKMLKHFLQNGERFYQLSDHVPPDLDLSSWNRLQHRMREITTRSVGNWEEAMVVDLVNLLCADEYADIRDELLGSFTAHYCMIANSIVNEVIRESQEEPDIECGFHFYRYCFEGLTENTNGKLVRSDLYLSKEGVLVVLKPLHERPSVLSVDKQRKMRTAYRVKRTGHMNNDYQREKTIQFYKNRTLVLANKHNMCN